MKKSNFIEFCSLSSEAMANEAEDVGSRQLAGVMLKNALSSTEFGGWNVIPGETQITIRDQATGTLASVQPIVRKTATMVIAVIAAVELPSGNWPDIIPNLVKNSRNENENFRLASIQTLGFICEELTKLEDCANVLNSETKNMVLTAIVGGMSDTEQSSSVKLESVRAVYNAIDFMKANFEMKMDRD
jgi:importin subunit beta-1